MLLLPGWAASLHPLRINLLSMLLREITPVALLKLRTAILWFPGGAAHRRGARYSLQLVQHESRSFTAVVADSSLNLVEPVLAEPSHQPDWFPSSLHPWNTANLLALNSYLSRDSAIPVNTIASVRVSTVDAAGQPKVLGTDKVQKDGSFFVQMPGNTPIRFELLNASGAVIRRERGWMWARAGEQRVCVGCHTGPERAPDNVVPEVLWNQSGPTNLTDNNQHSSN